MMTRTETKKITLSMVHYDCLCDDRDWTYWDEDTVAAAVAALPEHAGYIRAVVALEESNLDDPEKLLALLAYAGEDPPREVEVAEEQAWLAVGMKIGVGQLCEDYNGDVLDRVANAAYEHALNAFADLVETISKSIAAASE